MKNVRSFPSRLVIEKEACDWLIKLDRDEPLSHEEREALRDWLARSPLHRQELSRLNAFWSNNILTELVVPLGRHESSAASGRAWFLGGVAAATITVMVAIAWYFLPGLDPLTESNGLYLTAVGQQRELSLADGSKVQLNTNTQIAVDYSERHRNIRLLQGEAYFQVAENTERPFRVYAGISRIQAVGTAFIVYLNDKSMNVLVSKGHVALASLGRPPIADTTDVAGLPATEQAGIDPYINNQPLELGVLEAGESMTLHVADNDRTTTQELRDAVERLEEEELQRRQSWRNGLLVFTGEPLEQVVEELSRYTTISIEIADPVLSQLQIGGRFRVGEIDDMLVALETNFDLHVNWLAYNRVSLTAAR